MGQPYTLTSVGPSGVGSTPTATASTIADTVMARDTNGDAHANVLTGDKGVATSGKFYWYNIAKSGNFTVDDTVTATNATAFAVTTSSSSLVATFTAGSSNVGKIVCLQKVDSGTGTLTATPNGSDTFSGTASYVLYRQWDRLILEGTATGWTVLVEPEVLAMSVAASTAITANSEGTFDTSGLSISVNTLRVGDIIEVVAQGIISTYSSGTDTVKLKLGSMQVFTTGAVTPGGSNDIFTITARIEIRTIGASGTFVATGTVALGTSGTVTDKRVYLASTTIDTTGAVTVNVTNTFSASSQSARLDVFSVRKIRN